MGHRFYNTPVTGTLLAVRHSADAQLCYRFLPDIMGSILQSTDEKVERALACPCISDLKEGPCGLPFVAAFTCFLKSQDNEKACPYKKSTAAVPSAQHCWHLACILPQQVSVTPAGCCGTMLKQDLQS